MNRYFGRAIVSGWVLLEAFIAAPCLADSYDQTQAKLFAANPSGLSVTLRVEKSAFFMGERIRVTLDFQNNSATSYQLDTAEYDRSGRMYDPQFHVEGPEHGFADPLALYYATFAGIWGGLRGAATLELKGRYSQAFDLNEWVRFDLPGTYRVYCTSQRASAIDGQTKPVLLCSQIVSLTIAKPDAEWIAARTQSASNMLKSTDPNQRRDGARILRFLSEPEAVGPLTSLLGDADLSDDGFIGLVGTRDPSRARTLLFGGIREPEVTVTETYLQALAIVSSRPQESIISYDTADANAFRRQYERLQAVQATATKEALAELSTAISLKRGRAQAVACLLLLQNQIDSPGLRERLAGVFTQLPKGEQCYVLGNQWEQVRCTAFQATCERILSEPEVYERYDVGGIRTWAVYRYLEFQPEKARDLIMRDIRRPRPLFGARALISLPDKSLPELDDVLLANWRERDHDWDKIPLLIQRYVTKRVLGDIIALYREHEGQCGCFFQEQLLRYWIKHDQEAGLAAVKHAAMLRGNEHTGCYRSVLSSVLSQCYSPEAESLALSFIDDADYDVAHNVIRLLEEHGSSAIADPLLRLLENLKNDSMSPTTDSANSARRYTITSCLMKKRSWDLTNDQKKKLYGLLDRDDDRARFARRFPEMAGQGTH